MKINRTIILALALAGMVSGAQAQDAMPGHDMSTMGQEPAASTLPDICRSGGGVDRLVGQFVRSEVCGLVHQV